MIFHCGFIFISLVNFNKINSKKIKFDLMSYSESDNRLMSNNLSPWGCFEDFCRKKKKKNVSLGLKLFIKFMFRYSLDSHIELQ